MAPFLLIATILFCLALALPLVQLATGWPEDAPLAGMEAAAAAPAWRRAAWWQGAFQKDFDAWFARRVGFRGALVRTANQIRYALFNELATTGGDKVVPGRAGWFYEKVYVDAFRRGGAAPESELRRRSADVKRLQDRLAQDGIAFLLVIAPSKAEIYPEFLPPEADVAGRPARRSDYQNFIEHLRRDGVQVLDAHRLFAERKRAPGSPPLFARSGTHWNHYGAVLVAARLLEELARLTGAEEPPAVAVVGAVTNRQIASPDNDLGELANLWQRRSLAGRQVHPQVEIRPGPDKPAVTFITDSFGAQLITWLQRQRLLARHDSYWYNQRHYGWPGREPAAGSAPRGAGPERLAGCDAVVVVQVEVLLPDVGFGFVEETLAAYDRLDAALGAELRTEATP